MPLADTNREIGLSMRKNWQATHIQRRFLEIIESHYEQTATV